MKGESGVKKINIKQQIKDAKITLNRLLNPEQKPQKTIPNIPIELLDSLDTEELSKNGVSPEVFEIIRNEALEIKRAQEEAIEAEKIRAKLSAEKKETTSAEKKKIDTKKKDIRDQISALNVELRGQIDELTRQIEAENEKYGVLTGRGSVYQTLGVKENQLVSLNKKKLNVKYTESIKQAEISRLQEEIDNLKETNKALLDEINQIAQRISELKEEKNRIEAPIRELEEEVNLLSASAKSKRGGTLSNKKVKKYKITKRQIYNQGKKRARLTKRHKKIKIPKKTRKNI
jgi:chromosome segregation ATPase